MDYHHDVETLINELFDLKRIAVKKQPACDKNCSSCSEMECRSKWVSLPYNSNDLSFYINKVNAKKPAKINKYNYRKIYKIAAQPKLNSKVLILDIDSENAKYILYRLCPLLNAIPHLIEHNRHNGHMHVYFKAKHVITDKHIEFVKDQMRTLGIKNPEVFNNTKRKLALPFIHEDYKPLEIITRDNTWIDYTEITVKQALMRYYHYDVFELDILNLVKSSSVVSKSKQAVKYMSKQSDLVLSEGNRCIPLYTKSLPDGRCPMSQLTHTLFDNNENISTDEFISAGIEFMSKHVDNYTKDFKGALTPVLRKELMWWHRTYDVSKRKIRRPEQIKSELDERTRCISDMLYKAYSAINRKKITKHTEHAIKLCAAQLEKGFIAGKLYTSISYDTVRKYKVEHSLKGDLYSETTIVYRYILKQLELLLFITKKAYKACYWADRPDMNRKGFRLINDNSFHSIMKAFIKSYIRAAADILNKKKESKYIASISSSNQSENDQLSTTIIANTIINNKEPPNYNSMSMQQLSKLALSGNKEAKVFISNKYDIQFNAKPNKHIIGNDSYNKRMKRIENIQKKFEPALSSPIITEEFKPPVIEIEYEGTLKRITQNREENINEYDDLLSQLID